MQLMITTSSKAGIKQDINAVITLHQARVVAGKGVNALPCMFLMVLALIASLLSAQFLPCQSRCMLPLYWNTVLESLQSASFLYNFTSFMLNPNLFQTVDFRLKGAL